jgi:hypothetical protein
VQDYARACREHIGAYKKSLFLHNSRGAFGDVRLFAAAFENSSICLFFKGSSESGSEQPHISESFALQKVCVIRRSNGAPGGMGRWFKKM